MRSRWSVAAAFLPLIILMAVAYVWPVFSVVQGSFQDDGGQAVGWRNYAATLNSYFFWDSLLFTLKVSLLSALISAILAVVLALALRETFAGKSAALFISQYNLSIPRLAVAMIMVFLLSQTGFVSAIAHQIGLTESVKDFPWFVYDSKGIGLIIVFVWKFAPYIGLSALGVLQGASLAYEHQAATLGVGRFKRLIHIVLPNVVPAISTTVIIVFAAAFGDYEVPAILGSAQKRSVSVMLYLKYLDPDMKNRPEAYAMMVMTSVVLLAIIVTAWRFAAIGRRKRGL